MGVIHYDYYSAVLNCATRITITLPDISRGPLRGKSLDEIYKPGRKFPTLYLCHGGSGDSTTWYRNTQLELFLNEKNMMSVSIDAPETFYCDMKYGRPYFTYLTEEIPRLIQTLFPSSPLRKDNFIMGFSMGAHGAMKAALRCPDKFAAVMSISGAKDQVKMRELAEQRGIKASFNVIDAAFGPKEEVKGSENDLIWLAKQLAQSNAEPPMIFTACGTEDYGLPLCTEFHEYLDSLGLKNKFITQPGIHDYYFANKILKLTLDELFEVDDPVKLI